MSNVNVRVSKRVLWVGEDAYPLQNIARARAALWKPDANKGLNGCLGCLGTAVVIAILAGASASKNTALTAVVWVLVIGAAVAAVVWSRRRKPRYALQIETSGNPFTVLVNTDKEQLDRLVREIMDAIDNPEAEFQMQVENMHVGDRIFQVGDHNTGKRG